MPNIPFGPASASVVETAEEILSQREREELDKRLAKLKDIDITRKRGVDAQTKVFNDNVPTLPGWPNSKGTTSRTMAPQDFPNDPDANARPLGPPVALTEADIAGDEPNPDWATGVGNGAGGPDQELSGAEVTELSRKFRQRREAQMQAETRSRLLDAPATPDQAAADLDLATRSGVNRIEVEQDRETFKASDQAKDLDQVYTKAPLLRDWMADRANFDIAHDDAQNLSWWETIGSALNPGSISGGEAQQALQVGTDQAAGGFLGLEKLGIDIADFVTGWIPGTNFAPAREAVTGARQTLARNVAANTPQGDTLLEKGIYDALQSAPQTVGALIATLVTKSPVAGAASAGYITGGSAFGEAEDKGKDFVTSLRYAAEQGGIEAATELLPLKFLVGDLAKDTPFFKTFMKQAVSEGVGEQAATFLQDASTWLELNPEKTVGEFMAERPEAAIRTLIASTIMSGVQTTIAKGTDSAATAIVQAAQQKRAETLSKTFDAMASGAKDSKLLKRIPDKYREAVAKVTADGPLQEVRVVPEALTELAQANNLTTEQLAQAFRIDPADMNASIASGNDVVIPAGNYAAALGTAQKEIGISGETLHTALAPNMRLRSDDFTAKEHEAMKAVFEQEQKAREDQTGKTQEFADSADRVRETIREAVAGTKLFNAETANTQASIAGEMVVTLAERTGQDPEKLWKELGFDVVNALKDDPDEGSLPQQKGRTPTPIDDDTLTRAASELSEKEFEAWKGAREGLTNEDIAVRMGGEDQSVTLTAVSVYLGRAREKGFDSAKQAGGRPQAPETEAVLRMLARDVRPVDIARAIFPGRELKKAQSQVSGMKIKYADRIAAIRQKQLVQSGALAQGDMRGSYTPRADRSVIKLFESTNLSTFVHEASHWYLDTLWRMSQVENPHPFVLEQLAAIKEWKGKSPEWSAMFDAQGRVTEEGRDLHEAFAETFEAYLREGKAPSTNLRSVFASLKQWLMRIYKSISQIGGRVNLNDEIRAVFDRALASEAAITAAHSGMARNSEQMAQALLDKGVITEKAFERTKERLAAAREKAEAELMARLMEDYERNQKAWWRDQERQVRREVQSEVDELPEQRAFAWLSGKGWRDTRADHTNVAADEAEAMAALAQGFEQEQADFLKYLVIDATEASLTDLRKRMLEDKAGYVIGLFRTANGKIIAFNRDEERGGWSHAQARELMGVGDLKLAHGQLRITQKLSSLTASDWYDTSGTLDTLPRTGSAELGQFMPKTAQGAPTNRLMHAILMDIQGDPKEEIWRQTGWAQTKFGEWVWELPGEPQFKFNPEKAAQAGKLDQLIEWPELFEAMPALRNVYLVAATGAQGGKFEAFEPLKLKNGQEILAHVITARGAVVGSNTLMETIQHEIQHVIQLMGGFASNGSSASVDAYRGTKEFDEAKAKIRELEARFAKEAGTENDIGLLDTDVEKAAAFTLYIRNHGEWQARQVEWRSRMPADWRWANPPGTEVAGTIENVDEKQTWATLDELRAARPVQSVRDDGSSPATRFIRAIAPDAPPQGQGEGTGVSEVDGVNAGTDRELGQSTGRAAIHQQQVRDALALLREKPEVVDGPLSDIMDMANVSARAADQARRLYRASAELGQSAASPEPQPEENVDGAEVERQKLIKLLPFADKWGDTRDDPVAIQRARDGLRLYLNTPSLIKKMSEAELRALADMLFELEVNTRLWTADAATNPSFVPWKGKPLTEFEYYRQRLFSNTGTNAEVAANLREAYKQETGEEMKPRHMDPERWDQGVSRYHLYLDILALTTEIAARRNGHKILAGESTEPRPASVRDDPAAKQTTGFYSEVAALLKDMPDRYWQMGGIHVYNWLKKQPSVKTEELEDTKLYEFLTSKDKHTKPEILRYLADNEVRLKRNFAFFDPENPTGDYEMGGVRAFDGPRIPGRGAYFEDRLSFPKRTAQGEPFAPGMFESPHWGNTKSPNAWGSIRGSVREVEGIGKVVIGEELQSDFFQGVTERRPRVDAKQYLDWKRRRQEFRQVRNQAAQDIDRIRSIGETVPNQNSWQRYSDFTPEALAEFRAFAEEAKTRDRETARLAGERILKALDEHPEFFEKGANNKFEHTERSFTPDSPFKASWESVLVKALILRAVQQGADAVAISTSDTTARIQNNESAARFYDEAYKPRLEKIVRKVTGDLSIAVERVTLPAKRGQKAYSVWMVRLPESTTAMIRERGLPLYQAGDGSGRTAPPPSLSPMRLNLEAVRETYGEEALAALPPEVRAYAAAATDADQFVEIARDVRKTLNQKKPKTLTKFLSTRRVIGHGNDTVAFKGIRDDELTAAFIGEEAPKELFAGPPSKNSKTQAYTMSNAVMAAWEEGYFHGSPPSPAAFMEALRRDADETAPLYRREDMATVQQLRDAERWEQWFEDSGVDISLPPVELRARLEEVLTGESEQAISPDEAATYFGMPDGNALLQGLKEGPKRNAIIKNLTEMRMTEMHGDPFKDGTIMQEAEQYARNEVQTRQDEIELEALARAAGQQFAGNLAKQQAQEALKTKQIREVLNYNQWLTLEQRWMKKAVEAAEKGKFDEAVEFKRYGLINRAMFREGRKLAEQIEKTRKHLLDYGSKTKQARLFAAGADYQSQMNGLLDDYQLRPETKRAEDNRASRSSWIRAQMASIDPYAAYQDNTKSPAEQLAEAQEALERSEVLARLAEGVDAKNYKSLPTGEFLAVRDEADLVWRLATTKDRLIKEGERRRLTLATEDIAAEIFVNQPNPKPPEARESDAPGEKLKRSGMKYFAMHRTLQSLAHQFAGGKEGGVFWRYIVKPLNEAFAKLSTLRKTMGTDMEKLFSVYTKAERNKFFNDRKHFASIGESLTKQGRLAVALNWGNTKNRQRLMDSTGWTEGSVREILDTLDSRDWDFIQATWDYLDSWFPEANRVHEAVHNAPMDKVQPTQVATKFGIYAGGYFPIAFDANLSTKSRQRSLEADAKQVSGKLGVRNKPGFSQRRVEGRVTLPIKLSVFDVVARHLDQVATSIATEEALFDAGRLVMHKTVEDAIVERHGRQIYNTIVNTLVTTKFGLEGASGVLAHLRNGATVVGLGWKVATALLQPIGVTNSIVRVGGYWIAKGYARMGTDALTIKSSADWIMERSEFMQNRRQAQSPELAALAESMGKKGVTPRWVTGSMFALMTNVQFYSVDMPTWYGAYYKAEAAGFDEGDRIAQADQAVIDSQGGGELHQTAAIQTGAGTKYAAALRLLTNFMSYMVTTYNLATQRARNANTPIKAAALALDMVLLLAVPVAGKMALDAWTKGGGDDDDDPLWEKYGREQIAFLLSPFVGISQVAGAVKGDDAFGYRGPAGLGVFAEATNAGKAAAEADFDESFWRPANRTAGMIFHYPASQLDATVRGGMAMWNGETTDPKVLLFGPPPN